MDSDNSCCFTSEALNSLKLEQGITWLTFFDYAPMSDVKAEHRVGTMKQSVVKIVLKWVQWIGRGPMNCRLWLYNSIRRGGKVSLGTDIWRDSLS